MCYLNSFCEGSTLCLQDFSAKGLCDFSALMTVTKRVIGKKIIEDCTGIII